MKIKKNDFVEIEYTGREKETNSIFDTTDKELAQREGVFDEKAAYGPVTICIGEHHILRALDAALEGKELGSYSVPLTPENAFGQKSAKLIQLVATNKFKKEGINPFPGLSVSIDGMTGIVKSVTGGRTLVDFNHPLSGKDIIYSINVKRFINDDGEKINALMRNRLGIVQIETAVAEGKATVTTKFELPKEVQELLKKNALALIPTVTELHFVHPEGKA